MKTEEELILIGSLVKRNEEEENRFNELLSANEDWAWIIGQLIRHRLSGNFFSMMTENQKGYLFGKVRKTFQMITMCYNEHNKVDLSFLEDLCHRCKNAGIHIAALKGAIFNVTIYPLNARMSDDVDILIAEEDLSAFDTIMRNMGFIQSLDRGKTEATKKEKYIQRINYHDLVPYYKKMEENIPYMDAIKVDVNFHFDSKENDITRSVLNEGIYCYCGNGYSIDGLRWDLHLAHLCAHFYREASNTIWTSSSSDVDLYKIVDIENTFRQYTEQQIIKWSETVKKFNLSKQCYFTLFYLNQFYPKEIYLKLMDILQPDDIAYLNQVKVTGVNKLSERNISFFDKTFNMNYGRNFNQRDFNIID